MEKKKKRLIILSIIAGALILVMLLSSAIFKIKSVSVEYQTTLTILTKEDLNQMVDNANLPVGKSIFFSSLDENKASMEKNNPYAKINGIERKFPNSLVVLVSERVPVVRVKSANGFYVLDNELKVLNIASTDSEYNSLTAESDLPELVLKGNYAIDLSGVEEGDFISNDTIKTYVDAIYRGAVTPSKDNPEVAVSVLSTIDKITISYLTELQKVSFDITYTGESITSNILGDNNLVDNIYNVLGVVEDSLRTGKDYSYVNCTDGQIYAGN